MPVPVPAPAIVHPFNHHPRHHPPNHRAPTIRCTMKDWMKRWMHLRMEEVSMMSPRLAWQWQWPWVMRRRMQHAAMDSSGLGQHRLHVARRTIHTHHHHLQEQQLQQRVVSVLEGVGRLNPSKLLAWIQRCLANKDYYFHRTQHDNEQLQLVPLVSLILLPSLPHLPHSLPLPNHSSLSPLP